MNNMLAFLLPGLVSFLLAFLVTPLVIKLAWKWGLVDDPTIKPHAKKIHKKTIPRAGGLAIYMAIFVSSLIFLPIDKHLIALILGATILVIMGLLDDKYDLSPTLRLVIQFLAAGIPIIAGVGIAFISTPFGGTLDLSHPRISILLFGQQREIWLLADIFALFWVVTLMNFVNMGAKGVDGQLPGVVIIASVMIGIVSLRYSADIAEWPVIILAAIVAGAFAGFLPYNFYPQKIMPAFSGSNLAGFMLGFLSILTTAKIGTLAIVLAVPLIDTTYTVVRRLMAGQSPIKGDTRHLHHTLLSLGVKKPWVAIIYWLNSLVLGILALYLKSQAKFYTIVAVAVVLGGVIYLEQQNQNTK